MNRARRLLMPLAGPVLALVVAAIIASLVLLGTGDDVGAFWNVMLSVPEHRNLVNIANQTAILYLSGVAAAVKAASLRSGVEEPGSGVESTVGIGYNGDL